MRLPARYPNARVSLQLLRFGSSRCLGDFRRGEFHRGGVAPKRDHRRAFGRKGTATRPCQQTCENNASAQGLPGPLHGVHPETSFITGTICGLCSPPFSAASKHSSRGNALAPFRWWHCHPGGTSTSSMHRCEPKRQPSAAFDSQRKILPTLSHRTSASLAPALPHLPLPALCRPHVRAWCSRQACALPALAQGPAGLSAGPGSRTRPGHGCPHSSISATACVSDHI